MGRRTREHSVRHPAALTLTYMFTKNKILLGLVLALFTFAAPNRAQADPFFFTWKAISLGNNWFLYQYFGQVYIGNEYPRIYKNGFGWLQYWSDAYMPNRVAGGGAVFGNFFKDDRTGDYFYTNFQYYDVAAKWTWFYSWNLGTWLYYVEPPPGPWT